MRVAIVAESFLPHMNGVTGSVLRCAEGLRRRGHEVDVIAPGTAHGEAPPLPDGTTVRTVPSFPMPSYPEVRVAAGGSAPIAALLRRRRADVVHLASPFVLGWRAAKAARRLGVPIVAAYQTRVPAYAARYRLPGAEPALWGHVARVHRLARLTLAPSTSAIDELRAHGVGGLRLWRRGVDAARFAPAARSDAWRARHTRAGNARLIGYVGRLAAEKQVEDLAAVANVPGTTLVIVGDGPARAALERRLPNAVFTGFLDGDELATAVASLDVFVHPGPSETFCQGVQEAMSAGVPVVAVGSGGPLDLVEPSHTGWLYAPGDLLDLRARIADLTGDDAKRAAFGEAARGRALLRSWSSIVDELVGHYDDALGQASAERLAAGG